MPHETMARDHATRANDKCPRLYVQNSAFSALSQKGGGARPGRGLDTTRDMTADGPKYLTQSGKEKGDPKVALVPDRSNDQDHSPVSIFFAKLFQPPPCIALSTLSCQLRIAWYSSSARELIRSRAAMRWPTSSICSIRWSSVLSISKS